METTPDSAQSRKAAVGGLAVVGFIALILIGIATAIYAASFLPKAFSRIGSANVYLSSLSQPSDNSLQAVNNNPTTPVGTTNAPTSIPLSPATTTTVVASTPTYTQQTQTVVKTPVYTQPTYRAVPVSTTPSYYGLPDLTTVITSVGYLRNNGDTNSYVAANTVPSGYAGAVRFVISNRGTNTTGSWYFEANLPGAGNSSNYRSDSQRSLAPGDSIVYTLGFDSTTRGSDTIRIEADPNDRIDESNEGNNTDTESIYLNGNNNSSNNGSYDSNGNYCRYGTYYQNGRYYCESSSNSNSGSYDSNGNYCQYGTYYQNGRYYCDSNNGNNSNNSNHYDSNGNYCQYGTYYQNGRYYCDTNNNGYNGGSYDSNGNYCQYGTYYYNNRYYCS